MVIEKLDDKVLPEPVYWNMVVHLLHQDDLTGKRMTIERTEEILEEARIVSSEPAADQKTVRQPGLMQSLYWDYLNLGPLLNKVIL